MHKFRARARTQNTIKSIFMYYKTNHAMLCNALHSSLLEITNRLRHFTSFPEENKIRENKMRNQEIKQQTIMYSVKENRKKEYMYVFKGNQDRTKMNVFL